MKNNPSSHAGRRLYFSRDQVSVKKPLAREIGLDTIVEIFEKFVKTGGGHRALGSPRAESNFVLVQRRSLLSPKRCCKHMNTTNDKFPNSKTCEQGMQHLFIDVPGLNSYSRIKWEQVFDVQCVGDDPLVLVLDLVCP
jgi:hypothetical protein